MGKTNFKLSDFVGGNFLRKQDLEISNAWVVKDIQIVTLDDKEKPQLELEHKNENRSFTLNATNTKTLMELFGDDPENTKGTVIILETVKVAYKAETFDAIRIDKEATSNHAANEELLKNRKGTVEEDMTEINEKVKEGFEGIKKEE